MPMRRPCGSRAIASTCPIIMALIVTIALNSIRHLMLELKSSCTNNSVWLRFPFQCYSHTPHPLWSIFERTYQSGYCPRHRGLVVHRTRCPTQVASHRARQVRPQALRRVSRLKIRGRYTRTAPESAGKWPDLAASEVLRSLLSSRT